MGRTRNYTGDRRVYYFITMEETLKKLHELQKEAMDKGISFDIYSYMSGPSPYIEISISYFKGGTVQENRALTTKFEPRTIKPERERRFNRIEKFIKDIS